MEGRGGSPPEHVDLQSVGHGQGLAAQLAEEAVVQVHPETLEGWEVGLVHALHDVVHDTVHLDNNRRVELVTLQLALEWPGTQL